jgi:hypothetical protein
MVGLRRSSGGRWWCLSKGRMQYQYGTQQRSNGLERRQAATMHPGSTPQQLGRATSNRRWPMRCVVLGNAGGLQKSLRLRLGKAKHGQLAAKARPQVGRRLCRSDGRLVFRGEAEEGQGEGVPSLLSFGVSQSRGMTGLGDQVGWKFLYAGKTGPTAQQNHPGYLTDNRPDRSLR